jgi:hypothetical protein
VQAEVQIARDVGVPICPVWAAGTTWSDCVPFEFVLTQHVDCRSHVYETGIQQLVAELKRKVELRASAAPLEVTTPSHPVGVVLVTAEDPNATWELVTRLDENLHHEDPTGGAPTPGHDLDIAVCHAMQGHEIAHGLSALDPQADHEIVLLWGHTVAGDEVRPPTTTSKPDRAGPPQHASDTKALPVRALADILSMSLPPNVRLLAVISRDRASLSVPEDVSLDPPPCPWADALVSCAPYVLGVGWGATDQAERLGEGAQVFASTLLVSYARNRSIERATNDAQVQLKARGLGQGVRMSLLKRARSSADGTLVIEAKIAGFPDPVTLDLSAVQASLAKLGLSGQQVLDLLARKIRAHRIAFAIPRETAILSIDSILYGEFSWDPAAGVMTCKKLFRFREDISEKQWEAWCKLLVTYNDLCGESFKHIKHPGDPAARTTIRQSCARFATAYRDLSGVVTTLVEAGCRQARRPYAETKANLDMAETKLKEEAYGHAVAYLDTALSTLHDLVNMCRPATLAETDG